MHLAQLKLRNRKVKTMKTRKSKLKNPAKKPFTFGDLIVAVYGDRNKRRARAILQFAVNAHLVAFPGSRQVVIS